MGLSKNQKDALSISYFTELPLSQIISSCHLWSIPDTFFNHEFTSLYSEWTSGSATSWASVGNGEGAHGVHLGLLKTTKQKRMLCFPWPLCSLLMCSGSLLGNISSPDVPRKGGPHSCFMAQSLNAWTLRPAGITDGTGLWSEVLLGNAATMWHVGAMTGRAL